MELIKGGWTCWTFLVSVEAASWGNIGDVLA